MDTEGAKASPEFISPAVKTLAGVGLALLALFQIFPPQGPIWPYIAYTIVAPLICAVPFLFLRSVRESLSAAYDRLGSARVPATSLAVFVFALLGWLWFRHLPTEAQRMVIRGFFPAFVESQAPTTAPSSPNDAAAPGPLVFVPENQPAAPGATPPPLSPQQAEELRALRRQVAELERKLAEAERRNGERPAGSGQAVLPAPAEAQTTAPPATSAQANSPEPTPPLPPKQIPMLASVVPTDDPLVTLSAYLVLGQNLRALYVRERGVDEVERQVNAWYQASLQYIGQKLGVDYAARYRTYRASGLGIVNFPVAKMGMVDGIDGRIQHLVTFLTELRQRR